jgi:hypothetical protein
MRSSTKRHLKNEPILTAWSRKFPPGAIDNQPWNETCLKFRTAKRGPIFYATNHARSVHLPFHSVENEVTIQAWNTSQNHPSSSLAPHSMGNIGNMEPLAPNHSFLATRWRLYIYIHTYKYTYTYTYTYNYIYRAFPKPGLRYMRRFCYDSPSKKTPWGTPAISARQAP